MNKTQLLPPLTEDEYRTLKADIAKRGVLVPIVEDEEGRILDGHHRLRAWDELTREGVKVRQYPSKKVRGLSEEEKDQLAYDLNLHRRHLTGEQRDKVIAEMKSRGLSNRAIAEAVATSKDSVRRALAKEEGGASEPPSHVTSKDGQRQPARKLKAEEIEERRTKAKELRTQGLSYKKIADQLGVSDFAIRKDLKGWTPPSADTNEHVEEEVITRNEKGALVSSVYGEDLIDVSKARTQADGIRAALDRVDAGIGIIRMLGIEHAAVDDELVRRIEDVAGAASDLCDDVLMVRGRAVGA